MRVGAELRQLCAVLATSGALLSCSGSETTSQNNTGTEVQASPSIVYSPASVTIGVGATVTWVFGSVGHTVTFDAVAGRPGDIPGPATNTSISRTFATAGTYTYHCTIHPSMTGSVVVGSNGSAPPPPPPPPPYGAPKNP